MVKSLKRSSFHPRRLAVVKTPFKAYLILSMILCASLFSFSSTTHTAHAYRTAFAVVQVFWGTSLNRTAEVYPGDQNVPLTVVIQNVGTGADGWTQYTINGIRASLWLPTPAITDVTGASYSSAYYSSATGVPPGGSFSLTFRVNINTTASPGTYSCEMNLKYLVQIGANWVTGEDQSLAVSVPLLGKCTLVVTATGNSITAGSSNTLYINILNNGSTTTPVLDVSLTLPTPLILSGDNYWHFTNVAPGESAKIQLAVYVPPLVSIGTTYQATLSIAYQTPYGNVRTETHLVGLRVCEAIQPLMAVSIVGGELTAGSMNNLYFTIKNNGSMPVTVLDLHLTLPPPLVLFGDSHWHFTDIAPRTSVKISASAYAPIVAAGTAYQATLSLTYQTQLGDVHTETLSVGLIVLGVVYPALTVSISGSELIGGYANNVSLTITNVGSDPISILDSVLTWQGAAAATTTPPLLLMGDNKWRFTDIPAKGTVSINLKIFSTISAIGGAYQGTLAFTYQDRYGNSKTENHVIGFYVKGLIQIVVYGASTTPTVAVVGSSVSVSANLLNKGNTAAMYTNVSVARENPWIIGPEGIAYIGQVDPNSPAPFTVTVRVNPTAGNGTYPLTLLISSQDERYVTHFFKSTIQIRVTTKAATAPQLPSQSPLETFWARWMYYILAAVFVALALGLYFIRRRRKKSARQGFENP
jgi:hypothetical protein